MKNKDVAFSRVELVLGVVEAEEFTIKGDIKGTVWKLKKEVLLEHSDSDDGDRWSITDNSCAISSQELLRLINQPQIIQSLNKDQSNSVFYGVNNTITGIASQIIISLLLTATSTISLLINLVGGMKIGPSEGITFIPMILGIVLFGYNCYKLGSYISENKETLI